MWAERENTVLTSHVLFGAVGFALAALVGCGRAPDAGTGTVHAAVASDAPSPDIAAVRVEVTRAGAVVDTEIVPLRPDQPVPDGGVGPGADLFFTLAAGAYDVSATALSATGTPSTGCARASATASVRAGHTTEIALALLCDGTGTGGLDVVVNVEVGPTITKLTLDPSKFIDTCQTVSMDVMATIPSGAPLTYTWTVTAAPPGASSALHATGTHATFSANVHGDYEITVTVTAPTGQAASLSFPVHVGGATQAMCGCQGTTELCFNGIDDDCDGRVDCDDPDCNPTAVCVPDPGPGSFDVGVALGGSGVACPPSFKPEATVNSGLTSADSCGGCSCGVGATACSIDRVDYNGPDSVGNCTANNQVNAVRSEALSLDSSGSRGNCVPAGGGPGEDLPSTRWGGALKTSLTCGAPSGSPVLPPVSWLNSVTFCAAAVTGQGCAAGQRCVPRASSGASAAQCLLAPGVLACPSGYADLGPHFGGFSDARSCTACSCSNPSGGSCAGVMLGRKEFCSLPPDVFTPVPLDYGDCGQEFAYELVGSPTPPMCAASSPVEGTVTPTSPFTLCCL